MKFEETRPLPAEIDTPDAIAGFLDAVAARLAPGLEETIGEVRWRHGDLSGYDWSADGHLEDGTLVTLRIRLPDRTIFLLVDGAPIFRRYTEPGRWVDVGLIAIVVLGIVVGLTTWSFIWGVVCAFGVLGVWLAIDIAKQGRDKRAAAARTIDGEFWRQRLNDALDGVNQTR